MKNIFNCDYHTHPCILSSKEKYRDFIKKAVDEGLHEICFTDHAPIAEFPLGDRIPCGRTREYCEAVREAAEEYRGIITVKCGIEIDYLPSIESEIEKILSEGDFDHILGSSHLHLKGMLPMPLSELTAEKYARLSLENTLCAVKSGYFGAVSHIDMYRFAEHEHRRFGLQGECANVERLEDVLREIFSEMEKRGTALEINSHLFASSSNVSDIYPSKKIMEIAAEYKLDYCFGSDAHRAVDVGFGRKMLENSKIYGRCITGEIQRCSV